MALSAALLFDTIDGTLIVWLAGNTSTRLSLQTSMPPKPPTVVSVPSVN
ncbi:hypothetical protein [Rhodococcus xishaensis]|nr:hypothetical protein [Rhodococcus xishaensis]